MKGKKTDINIKAEVITSLMQGKQGADIARELGVHESTVSRIKDNDLQEVARSSDIIAEIIEEDMQSIKNMSEIVNRFTTELKNKDELDRNDISVANTSVDSALKRRAILGLGKGDKGDTTIILQI